jgi:hypothetical protein
MCANPREIKGCVPSYYALRRGRNEIRVRRAGETRVVLLLFAAVTCSYCTRNAECSMINASEYPLEAGYSMVSAPIRVVVSCLIWHSHSHVTGLLPALVVVEPRETP